jgi:hypothetical protein
MNLMTVDASMNWSSSVFKSGPEDQSFNEGQRERVVQEGCLCLISWKRKFELGGQDVGIIDC